jgi:hypothetical protein
VGNSLCTLLLRRRPRAPRVALGGGEQCGHAAHHLTTSTFDILQSDPKLGCAVLAYMNDATESLNAYPALWAPFVVVGEGAAR